MFILDEGGGFLDQNTIYNWRNWNKIFWFKKGY